MKTNQRQSIIQDTTYYLPSNFLGQAISLVRGIVVRRLLGPLSYGWLNIFTLIERYAGYTDMGLINAMDRELPLSRGRGDKLKEEEIENNVFTSILISSVIIALAVILYGLTSSVRPFSGFAPVLRVFALFLILYRLSTFFSIFLRTHRKFQLLSTLNVLRGGVALGFIIFLAKRYLIAGIFGAEIISLVIFLALSLRFFPHPFSLAFNLTAIRRLIGIGFPLLLVSLTAVTIRNFDRFMIITFLKEPLLLGYYSAGLLFSNTIVQIPDSISVILFPRLLEDFGKHSDIDKIKKYVEEPTIVIAYLMGIVIALALVISPFFLKYILPQYEPGLRPLQVLLAGAFFISLVNMSGAFLIAINKQHYFLGIGGAAIILGILLSFIFIKAGLGLIGIALATALVYFIYNTMVVGYAFRFFQKGWREVVPFFLKIYFPFFYLAPWLVVLHRVGHLTGVWTADLMFFLLRLAGLVIVSMPFFIYLERNHSLFKGLKRVVWPG